MRDLRAAVADACSEHGFGSVDASFGSRKEFFYSWRTSGTGIRMVISDYLEDAPDEVLSDLADMICRRARRMSWREPRSFVDHVSTDGFVIRNRPTYIDRSRNLLGTDTAAHSLSDSADRLLDMGLLSPEDIDNSYMSWTRRPAVRRVGFCSTMMRVVGISIALDSDDVPDLVRDYVVYHECLHLRQGYRVPRNAHDREFRSWERGFPDWQVAESYLRRLRSRTRQRNNNNRRAPCVNRCPRGGDSFSTGRTATSSSA